MKSRLAICKDLKTRGSFDTFEEAYKSCENFGSKLIRPGYDVNLCPFEPTKVWVSAWTGNRVKDYILVKFKFVKILKVKGFQNSLKIYNQTQQNAFH